MPQTERMETPEIDHAAAIEAERQLLSRSIRSDHSAVEALLHPDFAEIGASGRFWQRDEILELITSSDDPRTPEATHFEATTIARDTVLLTYACTGTRYARRSSIWQRVDGAWKIRFHQGTPA